MTYRVTYRMFDKKVCIEIFHLNDELKKKFLDIAYGFLVMVIQRVTPLISKTT
jgi:hypothetical protein